MEKDQRIARLEGPSGTVSRTSKSLSVQTWWCTMRDNQYYFTSSEAAEFLRYAPTTLAVWRCEGRGPQYTKGAGSIRYRRHDLENWLSLDGAAQRRAEEEMLCHIKQRAKVKRPRGRAAVAQRDRRLASEPYCRDCSDKGDTRLAEEVDHIVPFADGGSNAEENVRCLCGPCHQARTRERLVRLQKTNDVIVGP